MNATIKTKTVTKVVTESVGITLELNLEEAKVLCDFFGRLHGDTMSDVIGKDYPDLRGSIHNEIYNILHPDSI